jgi:hypothetical protein
MAYILISEKSNEMKKMMKKKTGIAVGEGGRGRAADREGDSRINFGGKKRE